MTQTLVNDEGCFTRDSKNAINGNFSELYADSNVPTSITASTYVVTASDSGKLLKLDRAAGIAVTLPTASGTGNYWQFIIGTTITSNSTTIKVNNSTDIMAGVATMGSSGGTSLSTGTATTSDTITFNGTTTGGILGTYVEVRDIATGFFWVTVHGVASGTAATPFSATV